MERSEALRTISVHEGEIKRFGVRRLALFGSVARDEAGPESDVDVLVEFDDRPIGLFEFVDLQRYLESILMVPVDLVTEDGLKRQLRENILKEAIPAA
ncbi:MAG: nucleotidyltransferase family protein [Rubrobacteraceae bacterium]|nr:nucleotidyltransferase family protein [Rubrobacteraceae bacterium]